MLTSKVSPTLDRSPTPRQHSRLTENWPLPFQSSFLHSPLWILCSSCQSICASSPWSGHPLLSPIQPWDCMGLASAQLAAWIIPLAQYSGSQPPKYLLSVALVWQVHCFIFHSSRVSPPLPQAPRLGKWPSWFLPSNRHWTHSFQWECGHREWAVEHTSAFNGCETALHLCHPHSSNWVQKSRTILSGRALRGGQEEMRY